MILDEDNWMKFSVQPLINKRIFKIPNTYFCFAIVLFDAIYDIIHRMNFVNRYKITDFILFLKVVFL